MLVKIGAVTKSDDVVDLLLACHERIRSFTALARAVGERSDVSASEVADACSRVERYFTEALPLHVRDEEDSLFPRLHGLSPAIDEALLSMKEQHAAHEQVLGELLFALSEVRRNPSGAERRAELVLAAERLDGAFAEHLALEETVIFPALSQFIAPAVETAIKDELRGRRGPKTFT
jgi:iron-sulfur cluster repair protein YtfE (RIC family)